MQSRINAAWLCMKQSITEVSCKCVLILIWIGFSFMLECELIGVSTDAFWYLTIALFEKSFKISLHEKIEPWELTILGAGIQEVLSLLKK